MCESHSTRDRLYLIILTTIISLSDEKPILNGHLAVLPRDLTDAILCGIIKHVYLWRADMIHLINISPKYLQAIERLVKSGRFESLEQFVEIAIRNQIVYETQMSGSRSGTSQQGGKEAIGTETVQLDRRLERAKRVDHGELVVRPSWAFTSLDIKPFSDGKPTIRPLWGQFYRFLPVKLVVRLLARTQCAQPPEIRDLADEIAEEALDLADQLRSMGNAKRSTNGLSLAAGLPSSERDWRKSSERFFSQYVGRVRSDGTLDGFLAALGFAALQQEDKKTLIGLTDPGIEFASLPNPILDDGDIVRPLSNEEVSFLIAHIAHQMPGESDQLREVIQSISKDLNTPKGLDSRLSEYYRTRYPDEKWTDAKVSVMRAGTISRLAEMRLVSVVKKGIRVEYKLNESWREHLKLILTTEGEA